MSSETSAKGLLHIGWKTDMWPFVDNTDGFAGVSAYGADGMSVLLGGMFAGDTSGILPLAGYTSFMRLGPGDYREGLVTAQSVQVVADSPRINVSAVGSMLPANEPDGTFVYTSAPAIEASGGAGLVADVTPASQTGMLSPYIGPYYVTDTILADDNSDIAMAADSARTTYSVDGTGIKIGILSDSFNLNGGMAADITADNLPAAGNIDILKEGPTGGHDEGRAMAQLIHKVAPGAQIDFYTADDGESDFGAGILALAADGCNVIVDDVSYFFEPYYQDGSPVSAAIETVVSKGVDYFTSAGNDANKFYENSWTGMTTTLPGVNSGNNVTAFDFGTAAGGASSPFETFTIDANGTVQLGLQWDQPFASIGSGNSPDNSLSFYMFYNGSLLFSSTSDPEGLNNPIRFLGVTNNGGTSAQVQLAVVDDAGPAPGLFKIINFDDGYGGAFNDPHAGIGTGTVIGHAMVPVANTVGAVDYHKTPAFGVSTPVLESFSSVGGGELLFDSSGNRLASPLATGTVDFTAPDGTTTSVFNPFYGTSAAAPDAAAVAALMLQHNAKLTPAKLTADLEAAALPMNGGAAAVGAGFIQAPGALNLAGGACYAAGTRIHTPRGAVPIELLRIGDHVLTVNGAARVVRWIGCRGIDIVRHSSPEQVQPIRVLANAFSERVPVRDLRVSPEHALLIDGVLVPARLLVNGTSIVREAGCKKVVYHHIELDTHDVVLAENLPAETYLDTGNRGLFENTDAALVLHPDFANDQRRRVVESCVPFVVDADRIEPIWRWLAERALQRGFAASEQSSVTDDPALQVVVGDRLVKPVSVTGGRHVFVLSKAAGEVRLMSRSMMPSELRPWIDDRRRLGVMVHRMVLKYDDVVECIVPDDPRLGRGWWEVEGDGIRAWRWTDGDAVLWLPSVHAAILEVTVTCAVAYPVRLVSPEAERSASSVAA